MKKLVYLTFAITIITSLSACMVVPLYDAYSGPGVTVVAPVPYFFGGHHRHRYYR